MGAEYCDALYRAAEAAICLMEYLHGLTLYREYLSKCPRVQGLGTGWPYASRPLGMRMRR